MSKDNDARALEVFGKKFGDRALPEGCDFLPKRSAVVILDKVFDDGNFKTGYFDEKHHKDEYPAVAAMCKLD